MLSGEGIVEALSQVIQAPDFPYKDERALNLLAEMTSKGSLATDKYTVKCVEFARKQTQSVIGWIANRSLESIRTQSSSLEAKDFLVLTTGIDHSTKGDKLGQQYQTPTIATGRGDDFIISGRGIYAAEDPVDFAQSYQKEGWESYLKRVKERVTRLS